MLIYTETNELNKIKLKHFQESATQISRIFQDQNHSSANKKFAEGVENLFVIIQQTKFKHPPPKKNKFYEMPIKSVPQSWSHTILSNRRTPHVTGVISNFHNSGKYTLCITDIFCRLQSPVYTPGSHLTAKKQHNSNNIIH